ncbi:unnamed protein product [Cuscuta europaea]|uniref:Protein kinase domain-containing protein n=1 Tax=Cuscuta europaea TaxID=41803 RepID=A0A9P0ZGC8_CUSEU|nr:unnamed protein product [Cuscuta europaea]
MEFPEPPECPVCLQPYESTLTIPRVLACGHSACEACIGRLPNAFPNTIRCPACTQLLKLPKPLSSLPKNIDLLRFSSLLLNEDPPLQPKTANSLQEPKSDSSIFSTAVWPREFYLYWSSWILPENSVSTEPRNSGYNFTDDFCYLLHGCLTKCLRNHDVMSSGNPAEKEEVCLLKLGISIHKDENYCKFKCSYEVKVLRVLYEMAYRERNELDLILHANSRHHGVCKVYGFWYCEDANSVYLVCPKFETNVSMFTDLISDEKGCIKSWAMVGLDICEAVINLHLQGVSIGCFGASCFGMDEFGHTHVDICETLVAIRRFRKMITCYENLAVGLENENLTECLFVSPEAMFGFLKTEGVQIDYTVDVWSLASLLLWILIGEPFAQEMKVYLRYIIEFDEMRCDLFGWYTEWMERTVNLFERQLKPEFIPLSDIFCKCLDFNPENRSPVIELWKSLREVIVKPDVDVLTNLKQGQQTIY